MKTSVFTLASVIAIAHTTTARALDAYSETASSLEEIVVTAQKRSESIRDVPIAISALGAEQLRSGGLARVGDLSSTVPNLQTAATLGVTTVFLRGVGNGQSNVGPDSSIAYHADGVYIARPRAQTAGFFDVERIEVVRGPQGDLYGRNATGGAINVITRKPTSELSGDVSLSYRNYDSVRLDGAVSGPIAGDALKARIAGFYADHEGFGRNIVTGNRIDSLHEYGARLSMIAEPTQSLTIELVGDYYKADDTLGGHHSLGPGRPDVPLTAIAAYGGVRASDLRDIASERDPLRNQEAYGFAATATYEASDSLTVKSISAYRDSRSLLLTDVSGGSELSSPLDQFERQHQFSEEIQLLFEGDSWNAILGGYYFSEDLDGKVLVPFFFAPGAKLDFDGSGTTDAYAVFGNVNWAFAEDFNLILGLRYSHEKRTSQGTYTMVYDTVAIDEEKSWSAVTPKVTLQYQPSRDLQLYATASRGFKSGGYTIGSAEPPVDPEFLWDYEAGLKFATAGGLFAANLAAFYYDYTDLVVFRTVGVTTVSENAAKATSKGVEAEVVIRPGNHFRFDASVGYLDAKYTSYSSADPTYPELGEQDLSGKYLSHAPKLTLRTAAQYSTPLGNGELTIAGDVKFRTKQYYTPFNDRNAYSSSNAELGANISYELDSGLRLGVHGRNLTNRAAVTYSALSSAVLGYPRLGVLNEPRTYGVSIGYQF